MGEREEIVTKLAGAIVDETRRRARAEAVATVERAFLIVLNGATKVRPDEYLALRKLEKVARDIAERRELTCNDVALNEALDEVNDARG